MWHAWESTGNVQDFGGKPEGKRPLGRPRHRWEDGIGMDFRRLAGGVDWIQLAQDRDRWRALVNTVMNVRVLAPRIWLVGWLVATSLANDACATKRHTYNICGLFIRVDYCRDQFVWGTKPFSRATLLPLSLSLSPAVLCAFLKKPNTAR
jgi:hypothetical protein